jgi:glycosyltransferase involved in cell wall biosynthesis
VERRSAHFVVIGAYPESLVSFRGDLIQELVRAGVAVTAMAAPAPREVVARIEALGARFRPYPIQRNAISIRSDLATYVALRRALKELQPDVLLAYTVKPVIWSGLAARALPKLHFYALITGLGFGLERSSVRRRALASIVRALYRLALRRATGVLFQNEDDRDAFVGWRLAPRRITSRVFGSGVDCDRFPQTPFPGGPPTFVLIARLLAAKGLREFAEAARITRRGHPDAVFRIVGGTDPSPDRIEVAEVEAWQREGIVEYAGAMPDVRPALRECHVFVLPSYHEGMPRTVLEAMATGRPILTTDVPGCRDTVIEGQNGFLVPKGDPNALAERCDWFLANRPAWKRMGDASRQLAETRFNVHSVNAEMLRIMGLART